MRLTFFTFIFLFAQVSILAQTLSGKIVDNNQLPIQEVTVLNKNTDQHTHSDQEGIFIFENVSVGDSLQFYHVSYVTKTLVIQDKTKPVQLVLSQNPIDLSEVLIAPKLNALHLITDIDIQTNPVNSSQDVLRKIPGLFIGQHAGGGKAEQIFLRGFDIDHGTDINVTVDGLPVNMVSHAHGQGYADLHFVIPETMDKIDFGKGPYYGNKGNFTTAGYIDFKTKEQLDNSSIKLEAGQFNSQRLLAQFNLLKSKKHNAYIATEYLATDGPFDSPQNFNRINLFGKYTGMVSATDKIGITLSRFSSKWDASGQIPHRAVESGAISRFGAIDDTEGGFTTRTNMVFNYDKQIDETSSLKNAVFVSTYDFELYSNFTFFLEDPVNGDQIRQKEKRSIYGFTSEYNRSFSNETLKGNWIAGISLRNDQSKDNELSHTLNRSETLEIKQLGTIYETNIGAYLGTTIDLNKWTFNPSIRIDYFDFQYHNQLIPTYQTQEQSKAIASPKFNLLYNHSGDLQLYLKTGKGFHSNDTRVVIAQEGEKILPAAYGFDVGYIWKPTPKMLLNMAYWQLYLEQEFVYVGDAAIVEPSGKTKRHGIDVSYRYQPLQWLFWNLDANYTLARSIEETKGQDYIPLAPEFTLVSGLNFLFESGLYGSVNLRHLADRPANEDNSLVAKGYTVTDLNLGYKWKKINLGIQIQNLLNTEWDEAQFATESRLQNEAQSVEEMHFTPGTPFFLKTVIQYNF